MKKILSILIFALLIMPVAEAASTMSVGDISFDSTVVNGASLTVSSSVTASGVNGTVSVGVELMQGTSLFTIPTPTQTLTFNRDETKTVQWTITALSAGSTSFQIVTGRPSDGGTSGSRTSTGTVTVQERPVLSLNITQSQTAVNASDIVRLNYTITNTASQSAANATNVNVTLTLPSGWLLVTGLNPSALGTLPPAASITGYWIVNASSPTVSTLPVNVTSTIPGSILTKSYTFTGVITVVKGDVDGSGGVPNLLDVIYLLNYVAGTPGYTLTHPVAGDVDSGGGDPNLLDVIYLLNYVAGTPGYAL